MLLLGLGTLVKVLLRVGAPVKMLVGGRLGVTRGGWLDEGCERGSPNLIGGKLKITGRVRVGRGGGGGGAAKLGVTPEIGALI
jgi:hypothetical protein